MNRKIAIVLAALLASVVLGGRGRVPGASGAGSSGYSG